MQTPCIHELIESAGPDQMTPMDQGPTAWISVVIPALNAEARIGACLDALVAPTVAGAVKEVIVVDGGSTDRTRDIADAFGARVMSAPPGRGGQLRAGAAAAKGAWLLFLHADTVLDVGWADEARAFAEEDNHKAGAFRLAFDAEGWAPSCVAAAANWRARFFNLPYGDQGLLLSRKTYDAAGGYQDMPLFEDVDIIKRLQQRYGARSVTLLRRRAITSPERYERDGYARRVLGNFVLMIRFLFGASPEKLAAAYGE